MAVTLTMPELRAALRLDDGEVNADVTRLLASATALVERHAPEAPAAMQNEAVIRVAGYWYDQPTAHRGDGFSNAIRSSGAGSLLLPWVEHRAGAVSAS